MTAGISILPTNRLPI